MSPYAFYIRSVSAYIDLLIIVWTGLYAKVMVSAFVSLVVSGFTVGRSTLGVKIGLGMKVGQV